MARRKGYRGVAAHSRGSRVISREADEQMPVASARAERAAVNDEIARYRAEIGALSKDLSRAKRALAAERDGRESLRQRLMQCERDYEFGVGVLAKRAFPKHTRED